MSSTRISARMRRIKPSPSSAAADRFAELRRQGKDIINLAIGEPDFDTPPHIRQAAGEAIERGETRYTPVAGTLALRQAIVAKLQFENGLVYAPGDVIVTCGAKHALFNALSVTVEAGHEVIVPAPFWVSYPDMVLACDGTPVIVSCKEEDEFRLTPEALEAAITPATRWLVFNSPTNPTGTTYTTEQLRALADVLLRHPHVMVLADDIYEHIRFGDGPKPQHLLVIEPALRERTLVVNGVSKTYAMTGWRIGYAAGPADINGRHAHRGGTGAVPACQVMLRQFAQAKSDVKNSGRALSGQVSVGLAPGTAVSALALPLLKTVHGRHPDIVLHINESLGPTLCEVVKNGCMDMAVLYGGKRVVQGLTFVHLLNEELFVVAPTSMLPSEGQVTLKELRDIDLLLPRSHNYLRQYVDEAFAGQQMAPRVVAEIESSETLASAVALGVGATVLPVSAARAVAASIPGHLCRIVSPTIEVPLALCVSDHLPLSEPAQAVKAIVLELVERLELAAGLYSIH